LKSRNTSKLDNLIGALVGLAVGDAMGSELQSNWSSDCDKVLNPDPGSKFNWSDDTSMALCLADSLLECNGYDSYNVMETYYNWFYKNYRRSQTRDFDYGIQVATAIDDFNEIGYIKKGYPKAPYIGNGGIMRLAPAIIAAYERRSTEDIIKLARISSRETHYNKHADACAEVMAGIICQAIEVNDKYKILRVEEYSTGRIFNEILASLVITKDSDLLKLNSQGNAIETLQNALWGFFNSENFVGGMKMVLKLGGDIDTNSAVYGQIAGAYYGYNAIPSTWRDTVYQEGEIRELAEELTKMKTCSVITTRFEEDEE
jgi:ADP-ribosyl-[dinitrogen reductase] hydrolase